MKTRGRKAEYLYSFFNLGEGGVNATTLPLYPRERDPVPIAQHAVGSPGPV